MNTEIIDGILTFDELLEDDYYKSEFERHVRERLDIQNSHSDVKGGKNTMDDNVQTVQGETEMSGDRAFDENGGQPPQITDNPAVENTDAEQGEEANVKEPAREMSAKQFELYNETLRRVSKTARAGLPDRYNAFEDADAKTLVKQQIMDGKVPNIKEIAASVVSRLAPERRQLRTDTQTKQDDNEVLNLKAELALLKAGISHERIEAAKKLFIAEGGNLDTVAEFVARYPEWQQAQERRVVLTKAPPLAGKTAPTPESRLVLNDYERAVAAARKKAGLE